MSDQPKTLPPFPVDDETLNVIRDSLDRIVTGFDESDNQIYEGSPFGLRDVLNMLSGYDESKTVQAVNEYDQPIPDIYHYPDPLYSEMDLIRVLIDEIRRLRSEQEGPE